MEGWIGGLQQRRRAFQTSGCCRRRSCWAPYWPLTPAYKGTSGARELEQTHSPSFIPKTPLSAAPRPAASSWSSPHRPTISAISIGLLRNKSPPPPQLSAPVDSPPSPQTPFPLLPVELHTHKMASKAIPSHLKPQAAENSGAEGFTARHHGKTQSHMVSATPFPRSFAEALQKLCIARSPSSNSIAPF